MRLASIAVNRPMPFSGKKETTHYTIIAMYIPEHKEGEMENPETAHFVHRHCDNWQQVVNWVTAYELGSSLNVGVN